MKNFITIQIDFFGIVQGVGFRPHLFNAISKLNFKGTIQNRGDCVRLIVEGNHDDLYQFIQDINQFIPPLARIERLITQEIVQQNFSNLKILESELGENYEVNIPTDLKTCSECISEFYDPGNRRFLYPFIACTNCGPRYTVIESMPYDRANTSLKEFPLCANCLKEYANPKDRRFHAESMACAVCGPKLFFEDNTKNLCHEKTTIEISKRIVDELKNGKIIALRSLGGFQLICDARNQEAIMRLRKKKSRPNQSFALMAKNIETIKNECNVSELEENTLSSSEAPIVILNLKENTTLPMNLIAPDLSTVGVMLPTTPIHHLFFGLNNNSFDYLIVTSGNAHGEPIAITNDEARLSLSNMADYFLFHNREIKRRADDSIATQSDSKIQFWRHGRGLAPSRFLTTKHFHQNILALGADLKNTITLAYDTTFITSPHMGTLDNPKAIEAFIEMCNKIPEFYQKKIDCIVIDKHPHYYSSEYGKKLASQLNIPCIEVQHHHAHAKAVMAEYKLDKATAIVFDGTGYGDDGVLWGGELFIIDQKNYHRVGHISPFQLIGGTEAIKSPWRAALGLCSKLPNTEIAKILNKEIEQIEILKKISHKNINSPFTTSIGRYFDAISAILNIAPDTISYEAEAAIKLEKVAQTSLSKEKNKFNYNIIESDNEFIIDPQSIIEELLVAKSLSIPTTAFRFHFTIAHIILDFAQFAQKQNNSNNIVLSGGVFQNKLLLSLTIELLRIHQFNPIISKQFSPGDGQISFGQAIIASETFLQTN